MYHIIEEIKIKKILFNLFILNILELSLIGNNIQEYKNNLYFYMLQNSIQPSILFQDNILETLKIYQNHTQSVFLNNLPWNSKPLSHLQCNMDYPLSISSDLLMKNIKIKEISNQVIRNFPFSSIQETPPLINNIKSTDELENIGNINQSNNLSSENISSKDMDISEQSIENIQSLSYKIPIQVIIYSDQAMEENSNSPIFRQYFPIFNPHILIFLNFEKFYWEYRKSKINRYKIERFFLENKDEELIQEEQIQIGSLSYIKEELEEVELFPRFTPHPPKIFSPRPPTEPYPNPKIILHPSKEPYIRFKWIRDRISNIFKEPKSKAGIFSSSRRKNKQTSDFDQD